MEEQANGRCNVVYFCTSAQEDDDDVDALYRWDSAPAPIDEPRCAVDKVHQNARILLDEDQGGFQEVYLSSSRQKCLDKLEGYANITTTVVLVEVLHSDNDSDDDDKDLTDSLTFLKSVAEDVQGARWQRPVVCFVLFVKEDSADHLDPAPTAKHLAYGAAEVLFSPFSRDDLNRLVGHMKERTRPPARVLGTAMPQSLVDSIRNTGDGGKVLFRPDKTIPEDRMLQINRAIQDWAFSAHDLDKDELTCAVLLMIEHVLRSPQLEPYRVPRSQLMGLLLATRRQYKHEREVHYHNWRHAVDVTQSIFVFLLAAELCPPPDAVEAKPHDHTPVERLLTPEDGLTLLISAIGHDVGHPGVNNAFLVACSHPLAQLYNDKSVLENYHCAAYSQLLRRHWPALSNIPRFRNTMISNILATDMQRHFEYMGSLGELSKKVTDSEHPVESWADKDKEHTRELLQALMMKAADISNVARPFNISATWARILMNEFARQGELESELQIPTCLFGGPPNKEDMLAAAQSQKGFMTLFGLPLFQGICEIMPSISCSVTTLKSNKETWEQKIVDAMARRDDDGAESPLTFSSVGKNEVDQAIGRHHRSEPAVLPDHARQPPSTPVRRRHVQATEAASQHPAREDQKRHTTAFSIDNDDDKRASGPFLIGSIPLSPTFSNSRRSSKDVALDHLNQLSLHGHHGYGSSVSVTAADSRRGSVDGASFTVNQAFPTSRRGSKDDSLTTILVTSQGSPGRRSPSDISVRGTRRSVSPAKPQQGQRQSVSHSQKQSSSAARDSVPSSRSHATSFATTGTHYSPSTQPSSIATDDETLPPIVNVQHVAGSDDPLAVPGTWPTDLDGTASHHSEATTPSSLLTPNKDHYQHNTKDHDYISYPPEASRMASADSEEMSGHQSPRRDERSGRNGGDGGALRESRSRSRLRSLKFWKKKKDIGGVESPGPPMTGDVPGSP